MFQRGNVAVTEAHMRPRRDKHQDERDKHPFRSFIDSWQFWVGVAYFGLVILTIFLYVNYSNEAADAAARKADANNRVAECIASIPELQRTNDFVKGAELVGEVLLANSIASHLATPAGSELYRTQQKNIDHLKHALKTQQEIQQFPIPTIKQCQAERNQ